MNIEQAQEKLNKISLEFEMIGKILEYAKAKGIKKVNIKEMSKWFCGECGELRVGDARVEAGMKCSNCSYNY